MKKVRNRIDLDNLLLLSNKEEIEIVKNKTSLLLTCARIYMNVFCSCRRVRGVVEELVLITILLSVEGKSLDHEFSDLCCKL